jgi:hypothetical protein
MKKTKEISIKLPNSLSENSTREDMFKTINIFNVNKDDIRDLGTFNDNLYSKFIDENRSFIKKMMPTKGKAYRILNTDSFKYAHRTNSFYGVGFYAYILKYRLVKDAKWGEFIPIVKILPLNEDGSLVKSLSEYDIEEGVEFKIDGLSEEDFPEITKIARKSINSLKNNELATYERLKRKFN